MRLSPSRRRQAVKSTRAAEKNGANALRSANCDLRHRSKRGLRIVSSATHWPRVGQLKAERAVSFHKRLSLHLQFVGRTGISFRKEPYGKCGSERRAQHPQEIVDPGRLDARRAIELIDLVRVNHLHRIR